MARSELPITFRDLYSTTQKLLNHNSQRTGRGGGSQLHLLPPNIRTVAEKVETSRPLSQLAATIKIPVWGLARLLRRSGFYQGVAEGRSVRRLWADLRPHLGSRRVKTRILVLLDGCRFPVDRFAVPGGVVQRFTPTQIEALGPKPQVASAFFPKELLDSAWFSQQWFVCVERARNDGPTHIPTPWGHDLFGEYWIQLLPLALFDVAGFDVPIVLEARRGWSLRRIRWGEPAFDADSEGNEIPTSCYSVGAPELARLRSFLRFVRTAYAVLLASPLAKSVSRRYLRAIFVSGPFPDVAEPDDAEDALLQLTFGLEKLLLASGEREGIVDKLAVRAAYLAGLEDDPKREQVHSLVKQLYEARSSIVHPGKSGAQSGRGLSPWALRGLVRDLVVVFIAVRRRVTSDDEWRKLLRRLPISRRDQGFVARLAQRPLRLVRPPQ